MWRSTSRRSVQWSESCNIFRVHLIEIPSKQQKKSVCSVSSEQSSHKNLGFMQMTFCESLYYIVKLVMRYILNKLSAEAAEDITEIFLNDRPTCSLN